MLNKTDMVIHLESASLCFQPYMQSQAFHAEKKTSEHYYIGPSLSLESTISGNVFQTLENCLKF